MSQREDIPIATRRDFVVRAATAFASVGCAATIWPLIAQMGTNAATPPPEVMYVDLLGIPPGGARLLRWRGTPVFVRHRTREQVRQERATPLASLPDRLARNAMLRDDAPAVDSNRTHVGHEEWLVVNGLCTHMGCILTSTPRGENGEAWFCPCHAARFDASGRVRAGPARTNLPVPPYQFLGANRIRIG